MRVFEISGKFEQNKRWTKEDADFKGYFMKEDYSDIFIGYIEELSETFYDSIRYIKGLYSKENDQLVFLKMTNERGIFPAVYAFPDLKQNGLWYGYSIFLDAFTIPDGYTTVSVLEIESDLELQKKISKTYHQVLDVGRRINMDLLSEDIEDYSRFWDMGKD